MKFSGFMVEAQEQIYKEKRAAMGITGEVPYADFRPISHAQMLEVLDELRNRFGIPVNMHPSGGEVLEGVDFHGVDGNSHIIGITVDGLRQMAGDPEWHSKVMDKIQNWLDESAGFLSNTGGAIAHLSMSIDSSTFHFGYAIGHHASDSELTRINNAWDEFMRVLQTWLEGRNEKNEYDDRPRHDITSRPDLYAMLNQSLIDREAYLRERLKEFSDDELDSETEIIREMYLRQLERIENREFDRLQREKNLHLLSDYRIPYPIPNDPPEGVSI
jgi:hypothetical protein